jgi:hypothetical protein
MNCISEYLRGNFKNVNIRTMEHPSGLPGSFDPGIRAAAEAIMKGGNHLIIGSPISNRLCEEIICRMYGVPAFDPHSRHCFPYGHSWESGKEVRSSFGWRGHGKQVGIAELPSNKIVAPCNLVASGHGNDGSLVASYRRLEPCAVREGGAPDERIIICLSGHSGPGTLAAAEIATDPACAAELYPAAFKTPRMRAVAATYNRPATETPYDNRELIDRRLIEDNRTPPHLRPVVTA